MITIRRNKPTAAATIFHFLDLPLKVFKIDGLFPVVDGAPPVAFRLKNGMNLKADLDSLECSI
jgi:hypothetical protein